MKTTLLIGMTLAATLAPAATRMTVAETLETARPQAGSLIVARGVANAAMFAASLGLREDVGGRIVILTGIIAQRVASVLDSNYVAYKIQGDGLHRILVCARECADEMMKVVDATYQYSLSRDPEGTIVLKGGLERLLQPLGEEVAGTGHLGLIAARLNVTLNCTEAGLAIGLSNAVEATGGQLVLHTIEHLLVFVKYAPAGLTVAIQPSGSGAWTVMPELVVKVLKIGGRTATPIDPETLFDRLPTKRGVSLSLRLT